MFLLLLLNISHASVSTVNASAPFLENYSKCACIIPLAYICIHITLEHPCAYICISQVQSGFYI